MGSLFSLLAASFKCWSFLDVSFVRLSHSLDH